MYESMCLRTKKKDLPPYGRKENKFIWFEDLKEEEDIKKER